MCIDGSKFNLDSIYDLIIAKGINAKQNIIKENAESENFRRFLYYALNPMLTYNLSESTFKKHTPRKRESYKFSSLFDCCDYLSSHKGIDEKTTQDIVDFIYSLPYKYIELYIKLLSKTIRLGVTAKTVNKVIPGLIPEWEIQQAFTIEKYPIKDGEEFWVTEKLNGIRATYYNGKFIARSGAEINGLEHIIRELYWFKEWGYVLDGELTLKNRGELSDNEAFRVAAGIINSDSVDKTRISFTIFDVIPIQDFDSQEPSIPYSKRRELLDGFMKLFHDDFSPVRILNILYRGSDQSKIHELLDKMVLEDKEGLMINLDVPYKKTRHKGILKVKRFYTMDLKIVGYEEGGGRNSGLLGALVLDYKGNEVKVGSGFTDEQRKEFWENKESLVGSLCEVKYKEVSYDKKTKLESLQFPVFIQIRIDKSEVSYG